jgi:hypothetical protein
MRLGAAAAIVIGVGASPAGATAVNLTTTGASAVLTADLGGTFGVIQITPQSTGSGVIDSFLRINSNRTDERGYNTNTNSVLDNVNGSFTHALLLSSIPIITINGVQYREIFLDINQTNANPLQSLNQLQIFQSNGDPGGTFSLNNLGPTQLLTVGAGATAGTEIFRMSGQANPYDLQLNYALNSGSGSGDYRFFIANALFDPTKTNVVLYAQFGTPPGAYAENDGFEEFFVATGLLPPGSPTPFDTPGVPEPASLILLGTGLGFIVHMARRKKAA